MGVYEGAPLVMGRDQILDRIDALAVAADRDADTAAAAGWLRGILQACGRPVDGTTVDLGNDPTSYAAALPEPGRWRLHLSLSGLSEVPATVVVGMAVALLLPDARLTAVGDPQPAGDGTVHVEVVAAGQLGTTDLASTIEVAGRPVQVRIATTGPGPG